MLPKDWKTIKIESILQKVDSPVDVVESEVYHELGIRSHGKGIFLKDAITGMELGDKRVFWVVPDCLILNIVFAWEQAVARTTAEHKGLIASHRFPMYQPLNNACDIDYLLYYFKSKEGKSKLELASPGGAGRNKTLGQKEFFNLKIPLPPLAEQRKIAQILATWDRAIALVQKQIENSKAQKKALMQQLLTGKKRLAGFKGKWKTVKLGDVGDTYGGLSGKTKEDFGHGHSRYIPYKNVYLNSKVDPNYLEPVQVATSESQSIVQVGDVLFTTSSETAEELAMSSVVLDCVDNTYLNSFCFGYRFHDSTEMNPRFARFLFRGPAFRKIVQSIAQGSTRFNISKSRFLVLSISYPTVAEQDSLLPALESSFEAHATLVSYHQELQSEKSALMQQLLSGMRRVKVG